MDNYTPALYASEHFNNVEAEKAILGLLIVDASHLARVRQLLEPDDFYRVSNKVIYETILKLAETKMPDLIGIANQLKLDQKFDMVGGFPYLTELMSESCMSISLDQRCAEVWEHSDRRKTKRLIDSMQDSLSSGLPALNIVQDAKQKMQGLGKDRRKNRSASLKDLLVEAEENLIYRYENPGERGLKTHLGAVDEIVGGIEKGALVIIGARPGTGKTMLAQNIAFNVASNRLNPKTVVFFSIEMLREQIVNRIISRVSGVSMSSIKSGNLSDAEFKKWYHSHQDLSDLPLYIFDPKDHIFSIEGIRAALHTLNVNPDLVIVDYIQLLHGQDPKKDTDFTKVSYNSTALKRLALELGVPIVALSQLSREGPKRTDHRPRMEDLRSSGNLEQDADVIILIYRDEANAGETELIVAKNRNGEQGTARVGYNLATQQFFDLPRYKRW